MLDTITFTKNKDGSFTKEVYSKVDVIDSSTELNALEAQLEAFKVPAEDPVNQAVLDAAIVNYQTEIAKIKATGVKSVNDVIAEEDLNGIIS
jgi:hypothetical protein